MHYQEFWITVICRMKKKFIGGIATNTNDDALAFLAYVKNIRMISWNYHPNNSLTRF